VDRRVLLVARAVAARSDRGSAGRAGGGHPRRAHRVVRHLPPLHRIGGRRTPRAQAPGRLRLRKFDRSSFGHGSFCRRQRVRLGVCTEAARCGHPQPACLRALAPRDASDWPAAGAVPLGDPTGGRGDGVAQRALHAWEHPRIGAPCAAELRVRRRTPAEASHARQRSSCGDAAFPLSAAPGGGRLPGRLRADPCGRPDDGQRAAQRRDRSLCERVEQALRCAGSDRVDDALCGCGAHPECVSEHAPSPGRLARLVVGRGCVDSGGHSAMPPSAARAPLSPPARSISWR